MTQPAVTSLTETDTSTRQRILAATAEVLGRNGKTKLSLSEVAAQAGVSRPTLYRWFASKEELLSAFSSYERQVFESGLILATAGLKGADKLDAVLRFIVEYQHSYSGVRMVDVEPEHTIAQFGGRNPGDARGSGAAPSRTQRRGQGGHGDPDRDIALHRPQRRRRPIPGPTAPCGRESRRRADQSKSTAALRYPVGSSAALILRIAAMSAGSRDIPR